MKQKLLAAAALAFAMATPAGAADFLVTHGASTPIPGLNDFGPPPGTNQLNTVYGLTQISADVNSILVQNVLGPVFVRIDYLGSESGFNDAFSLGSGPLLKSEHTTFDNKMTSPEFVSNLLVLGNLDLGSLINFFTVDASDVADGSGVIPILNTADGRALGVFMNDAQAAGGSFSSQQIFIGYDDQPMNADDNHDDMILRFSITSVPESSTWAMLTAGFLTVGSALRRRRTGFRLKQAV